MKDLNARLRAAGLLAAAGSLLLIGLPTYAADAPAAETVKTTAAKKDAAKPDEANKEVAKIEPVEQIIVTGSRIRHDAGQGRGEKGRTQGIGRADHRHRLAHPP